MISSKKIIDHVQLGENVTIYEFVNLYGCKIGDNTKIGTFVEIQKGAVVGKNCKISSHSFICEGVQMEDEVFLGHGVCFINDKRPEAVNRSGRLQTEGDWEMCRTHVKKGASIGTGAVILGGVTIGEHALWLRRMCLRMQRSSVIPPESLQKETGRHPAARLESSDLDIWDMFICVLPDSLPR